MEVNFTPACPLYTRGYVPMWWRNTNMFFFSKIRPRLSWNPNSHCSVHNIPLDFFNMYFSIILTPASRSPKSSLNFTFFSENFVRMFLPPPKRLPHHIPPPHSTLTIYISGKGYTLWSWPSYVWHSMFSQWWKQRLRSAGLWCRVNHTKTTWSHIPEDHNRQPHTFFPICRNFSFI
jgi:hypothetical protein